MCENCDETTTVCTLCDTVTKICSCNPYGTCQCS